MKITIREEDGQMVAIMEGRLDTAASSQAEKDLQPLLDCEGREIILNCSQLEYIASSGLRLFLNILKKAKMKDNHVVIEGAHDYLMDVFSMTGFAKLFEMR